MNINKYFLAFLLFLHAPLFSQDLKNISGKKISIDHNKEIVFGQSASLSGHFELYGNIIQHGILACFNRVNSNGGIGGKKLRLISLDDHENPELAKKNVNYLRSLGVTMFIGNMGTRSLLSILPLIEQKKIALFFPWGGDEKLRNPQLSHIINGLGLLRPQLELLVKHIAESLKLSQVAIFHADDAFSTNGAQELTTLFKNYNIVPDAESAYNRLTFDIDTPAQKLLNSDPRVVICLASSMPTVKLINNFFRHGHFGTLFYGIDSTLFVSDILKNHGVPFSYTSSVPNPATSTMPIAQQYRQDLKEFFPDEDCNVMSFAYYISANIIVEALKRSNSHITKENILKNIEMMTNTNLGGFPVRFNQNNRHAFGSNITLITNHKK